ncbi:cysteine proteinase [Meredithblackwellia eburnea MCA 4105]
MVPPKNAAPLPQTTNEKLDRTQVQAYLERIALPTSLIDEKPSLDLLKRLQLAHLLNITFETTVLHVPSNTWSEDPETPIKIGGSSETVQLGVGAVERIVTKRLGGYCFSLNEVFAAFLRHWFQVTDLAARVYVNQDQNPSVAGWKWGATSHRCMLVGWPGEEDLWFVDGGFGGGQCSYPIKLGFNGRNTTGSFPTQEFKIKQSLLPSLTSSPESPKPEVLHWIVYRNVPSSTPEGESYWTPLYAFLISPLTTQDFVVLNHYNSTHPSAIFKNFFLVTRLQEGGGRKTFFFKEPMSDPKGELNGRICGKLQESSFEGKKVREEWVEMKVGPVREALEKEFGLVLV